MAAHYKEQAQVKKDDPKHSRLANSKQDAVLQGLARSAPGWECEPCVAQEGAECIDADCTTSKCTSGECCVADWDRLIMKELGVEATNGARRLDRARSARDDPDAPVGSAARAVRSDSKEACPVVQAVVCEAWENCGNHRPEEKGVVVEPNRRATPGTKGTAAAPEVRDEINIVGKGSFYVTRYIELNSDLQKRLHDAGWPDG